MFETIPTYDPGSEEFDHTLAVGTAERTYTEFRLNNGEVKLDVRGEGASIHSLYVGGMELIARPDGYTPWTEPVKIDATHSMFPVGKTAIAPQHGLSRYLSYDVASAERDRLTLDAHDNVRRLGHRKTFELIPDGLRVVDELTNLSDDEQGISLGEHFYFSVTEQAIGSVAMLDRFGEPEDVHFRLLDGGTMKGQVEAIAAFLLKGESVLHQMDFHESQQVEIAESVQIELTAHAASDSIPEIRTGLLLWHRPGTDTVCLEPVAGFSIDDEGRLYNDLITLAPGERLTLESSVHLTSVI